MKISGALIFVLGLSVLGVTACSPQLPPAGSHLQLVGANAASPLTETDALSVQFLGAGGVYLRSGEQALLGDPFFSNPPLSQWLFGRQIQVRPEVIDAHLPPLQAIKGILVGHSHFDHALDVPYVASKLPETVKIYANETLPNVLAAQLPAARLLDVTPKMANDGDGGEWIYLNPGLRILPIYSEHAPHVGETVFASRRITHPMSTPPQGVLDWQSGTNLNYIIDFLAPENAADNGDDVLVKFRVFYQSSASNAPIGIPPQWVLQQGVPVDLAILCAANFDHVRGYPETVLQALQPRQVLVIHWERFWDEYSTTVATPLPGLDLVEFEAHVRSVLSASVPVWLPLRGASIQVSRSS